MCRKNYFIHKEFAHHILWLLYYCIIVHKRILRRILLRNNIITLQLLIHNQLSSLRFINLFKYLFKWYTYTIKVNIYKRNHLSLTSRSELSTFCIFRLIFFLHNHFCKNIKPKTYERHERWCNYKEKINM